MKTHYDYSDKVVLITGAGSGFGELAAQRFAEAGARLAICDVNETAVEAVGEALRGQGREVLSMACDVSQGTQVEAFVKACVERYGRLDVAVNNAGVAQQKLRIHDCDEAMWDHTNNINLKGVFLCMKFELTQMLQQPGGSILNVSSAAGVMGAPFLGIYSAGKHGVIGLTKSAALEYGRRNIRVNAICPAFSKTPLLEKGLNVAGGKKLENLLQGNPMQRLGETEEIVQAMLWACCDDNGFMNGVAISLDGGLAAG